MFTPKPALLGLIATALAASNVLADSTSTDSRAATPKKTGRDPVAAVFQLPRGMILNKRQQEAYDDLKSKYESTLREAMDLLASKDPKDQSKGLKLNRDTRAAIRAGIKEIVSTSPSGSRSSGSSGSNYYSSQGSGDSSGYAASSAGYGSQGGGYSSNYAPPAGGGYPLMSGGGGMRGGCRGR